MPARESKQMRDMHQLLQQLEDLHSAHDLDHLGWLGLPDIKIPEFMKSDKTKAEDAAERKQLQATKEQWDPMDLEKKKQILTKFINEELTTLEHVKALDACLTKNDRNAKDIQRHKTSLVNQITLADDAKITEFTTELLNHKVTKQSWMHYIIGKNYDKPSKKAENEADDEK
jgi:hypothetical protein